jgi:hypothetical protein
LIRTKPEEVVTYLGSSVQGHKNAVPIDTKFLTLWPNKTADIHSLLLQIAKEEVDTIDGFRNWYAVDFLTRNLYFVLMRQGSLLSSFVNSQNNSY